MTDEQILTDIIRREGGYVEDHVDHGGPTHFGITLEALCDWRATHCVPEDVKALTESEARAIYYQRYIRGPGFDQIPNGELRGLIVDIAVNHGVTRAKVWVQRALDVPADGWWGQVTLVALAKMAPQKLYLKLCGMRTRFYAELVVREPSQLRFLKGWADRVADFVEAA